MVSLSVGAVTAQEPAEPPAGVEELFESAAGSLRQGDPSKTLNVLQAIESVEPDNPWMWYFRGSAHRRLGNPYQAMEAYDRALDELARAGNPDPELVERITRERRQVRRQVFNLSLQAGLAYDTNVTYGGDTGSADFISGEEDGKFATALQFDYVPWVTEDEAFAFGGRLSDAWYFSVDEFDYQDYGVYARYTRRLSEHWAFDLQYDYDFSYLGNDPFLSDHMIAPRFSYRWTPGDGAVWFDETALDYRIEAQDYLYETDAEFDRDGFANSVGLQQTYRIRPVSERPDWLWDMATGYRLEYDATQGSEYDRLSNYFYFGLAVPMTNPLLDHKELTARFLASWELDHYRNASLIDQRHRDRRDLITTLGLVLSQVLVDDPRKGDVILHGILNWTDADSNVIADDRSAPFSYDKLVAGFQLEWRF